MKLKPVISQRDLHSDLCCLLLTGPRLPLLWGWWEGLALRFLTFPLKFQGCSHRLSFKIQEWYSHFAFFGALFLWPLMWKRQFWVALGIIYLWYLVWAPLVETIHSLPASFPNATLFMRKVTMYRQQPESPRSVMCAAACFTVLFWSSLWHLFCLWSKHFYTHPCFLFVYLNYGTLQLNCYGFYATALKTEIIVGLSPSYFSVHFEIRILSAHI